MSYQMFNQHLKKQKSFFSLAFYTKKVLFSALTLLCFAIVVQTVVIKLPYFQALADCYDQANPRAGFLITSTAEGPANKFTSNIGTCIIDPTAAIGIENQQSYDDLYNNFFVKSKAAYKQTYSGSKTQAILDGSVVTQEGAILIKETSPGLGDNNLTISNTTTGTKTVVVFVEGDLLISTNFNYGDNNHGIVFVVKGRVYFSPNVTSFTGVIISQGNPSDTLSPDYSICTATTSVDPAVRDCPPASSTVATNVLTVDGSLVALTSKKPIRFTRKVTNNDVAAEQINQQIKYLVILNKIFSQPTNIISEGTNYAICTSTTGKPIGCSCTANNECITNRCSQIGTTGSYCQPSASSNPIPPGSPAGTPIPTPNGTPFPPKLVAHWKLDETTTAQKPTAIDSVGTNHGNVSGTTILPGRFGYARKLVDGSYIFVNNSPDFSSPSFTVSMWLKPNDLTTNPTAGLYTFRNGSNQLGINIQLVAGGKVNCYMTTSTGSITMTSTIALSLNNWNFVLCSFKSGNTSDAGKLYVSPDTALAAPITGGIGIPGYLNIPQNGTITIGKDVTTGKSYLGLMDDIRVYSYALSAAEISAIFNTPQSPGPRLVTNPWIINHLETIFHGIKVGPNM